MRVRERDACDNARREDTRLSLLDRGRGKLRLAAEVLTHWYDGMDCAESARRLGSSRTTVWRLRVWMGVQNRRIEPGSKSAGRLGSRRAIEGVTP